LDVSPNACLYLHGGFKNATIEVSDHHLGLFKADDFILTATISIPPTYFEWMSHLASCPACISALTHFY